MRAHNSPAQSVKAIPLSLETTQYSGARSQAKGLHCELAAYFPPKQLVTLNRALVWDTDMFELRGWKQSRLPFKQKPPNDKRHRSAERAWSGVLYLLVFGSGPQSVAKCCSVSEHFSPGGLPHSHFQSCVAGDESGVPRKKPSNPHSAIPFSPSCHVLSEKLLNKVTEIFCRELFRNSALYHMMSYKIYFWMR